MTTTMKTILTLEGVLKQVKEIGIPAERDTYAAIADRIFPTPACLEEMRNAVRLMPISEEVHAEMNGLPAALEAKRAREFCTRDQSWTDVIASRVLKRGDIVLVLFPHSDLRTAKLRPALIVQTDNL